MSKAGSKRARGRRSRNAPYIVGAIVAVCAVATVVLIGALTRDSGNSPTGPVVLPTTRPTIAAQNGHTLGDPSATVVLTEYLDFQCPHCERTAAEVMPAIEQQYIEPGVAQLEIRPIAILGSESVRAAAAAECAAEQGEFFAYHDMLFANQAGEQRGSFNDSRLKEFAAARGLDTAAFNSCLDSGKYDDQVVANTAAARDAGIRTTPTLLVNGVPVERTVEAISVAIQQAAGS